ncbi:MAG: hypothetical protein QM736_10015 [Vicinamibacterales bacterium]
MPACVPGRFRARVRRGRRSDHRTGIPFDSPRGGASLGRRNSCADIRDAGRRAEAPESVDAIVATIVREHRPGDLVVLMSNGGFGGIHKRLLAALDSSRIR